MGLTDNFNALLKPDRSRIRWRARRGLLENDILLTRFLDKYENDLSDLEVEALHQLLAVSDNDLMDYLLERRELPSNLAGITIQNLLRKIQSS